MELKGMVCPQCGSELHFEENQDYCFCSHCGTQVYKNDTNKKTVVYRNEGEIKKVEFKEKVLDLVKGIINNGFKSIIKILAIIFVITAIIYFVYGKEAVVDVYAILFILVMMAMMLFAPINKK